MTVFNFLSLTQLFHQQSRLLDPRFLIHTSELYDPPHNRPADAGGQREPPHRGRDRRLQHPPALFEDVRALGQVRRDDEVPRSLHGPGEGSGRPEDQGYRGIDGPGGGGDGRRQRVRADGVSRDAEEGAGGENGERRRVVDQPAQPGGESEMVVLDQAGAGAGFRVTDRAIKGEGETIRAE